MKINLFISIIFQLLFSSCGDNVSKDSRVSIQSKDSITNNKVKGQSKDSLISLLPLMNSSSLDCTADTYWKIIQRGKPSIPLLIESLNDTTPTNIYDHCKHGYLNVAEVCYFALEEITEFPAFIVTHIQFDVIDEHGCWSFYYWFYDNKNKTEYQKMVKDFYAKNKYVYAKFDKQESNDCRKQYKIEGKWKLKD